MGQNGKTNEIWKDIKGFEGRYQVSNMGRVRGLERESTDKNGRVLHVNGMILKNSLNHRKGYYRVSLSDGHRNYTHFEVHRLVAIHFVPGYADGLVVNHKNEIKGISRIKIYNTKNTDTICHNGKKVVSLN